MGCRSLLETRSLQERHMSAPTLIPTRVTRSDVGRRTVLSVSGDVDVGSTPLIADAVDEAIDSGALELWLDLSLVEFMDTAGAHLLLETKAGLRPLGRRLAVICPAGPARRLLELAGVAHELPLYDDRAAAHRAA
jgi:anti-sigma B factor antagonist